MAKQDRARIKVEEIETGVGEPIVVLHLVPSEAAAAPVAIQVDDEQQLTFYFGIDRVPLEEHDANRGTLLSTVHEFVGAVIEGGYSEQVKLSKGQLQKAIARLRLADGDMPFSYNALRTRWERRRPGWLERDYAPY